MDIDFFNLQPEYILSLLQPKNKEWIKIGGKERSEGIKRG